MEKRLFIVANRLPLTVESEAGHYHCRQSSGGLISAVNGYLAHDGNEDFRHRFWAGVPGCDEQTWNGLDDTESADFTYIPVFAEMEAYERYYDGFANSLLWPLFHYFPSYAEYHEHDFDAYLAVNRQFAERLLTKIRPGDVVWIHDYHLLPLAAMLRRRVPGLSIGLFLHIPFPVFEVFRLIPKPWQKQLLTGMLGADLIGFHTASYRDYFLQAAEEALQADTADSAISWEGRTVNTGVFPVSIDFGLFHNAGLGDGVQQLIRQYESLKGDKKLLFSVDRLDYTKGVHHRIKGYKKFLLQHPEYCGRVVFVLVIVPSRHHIKAYAERKRMIDEYIGDINSSLGTIDWKPVIYQYQHLEFDELAALYRVCDVGLITPIRDGMNLVAKEFVASRSDGRGVLILSELAGAAAELSAAILINPNDAGDIASAIRLSLEMAPAEQEARIGEMQAYIKTHDVNQWASGFLKRLEAVTAHRALKATRLIDPFSRANLLGRYRTAKRRLLLLDYDGTLSPFTSRPEQAIPSNNMLQLLAQLAANETTDVYIVSGRDSTTLENWFGHLSIGLVAEHGAKIRYKAGIWLAVIDSPENCWPAVEALINTYVTQCPGSFMEKKEFSRAWHYREAEAFHSDLKAAELYRELLACTGGLSLKVLRGHKVIEVRSRTAHKGHAVNGIMQRYDYDFIFCAGDDETDEDMFKIMANVPAAFTVKVGKQPSLAAYRLLTPYQVQSLLDNMLNSSLPLNRQV